MKKRKKFGLSRKIKLSTSVIQIKRSGFRVFNLKLPSSDQRQDLIQQKSFLIHFFKKNHFSSCFILRLLVLNAESCFVHQTLSNINKLTVKPS